MASLIEDYALIGNCASAALVGKDGSIDWAAMPRFDDAAFFAALLGGTDNGRWQIAPVGTYTVTRRYRPGTLVLETRFETTAGVVVLTDAMTRRDHDGDIVRLIRCESGAVDLHMDLCIRFGYGAVVPWVTKLDDGRLTAVAGPDRLTLACSVEIRGENMRSVAKFTLSEGQETTFALNWAPSYWPVPDSVDAQEAVALASEKSLQWSSRTKFDGPERWKDLVERSALTLKALTHFATGGIVAAPTTSLPESLGGERNWDYRFCWLRDATLTLYALMTTGFVEEAAEFRTWMTRAIAGSPEQVQIMYGVAGERQLDERELPWLSGYEGSKPVRIGNAASTQLQLDVFGEVLDAMYQARRLGMEPDQNYWRLQCALIGHLDDVWDKPDAGIWEIRGEPRHFTHSKVMAWVAYDRAVRSVEEDPLDGPVEAWRATRDRIHAQVCAEGYDEKLGYFTQSYGSTELDASLLLIALVGFLPATDPRVVRTVKAIERTLLKDGFVLRYNTSSRVDGLAGDEEGAFLPCSFWLVDNLALMGRDAEANAMFERLVGLCNDVGLLSEEYDVRRKRQVGNFPQAFTHVALINSAHNLGRPVGPAQHRAEGSEMPEVTI
jgi:GH15 family glucan-1,4-alpha-glucosidase